MKIKLRKIFFSVSFSILLVTGCTGIEPKGTFSVEPKGTFSVEPKGTFSFKRSLNIKSYGYEIVSAPYPVRAGETSERFEVRPGDCYWDARWSDCENDRERSELSEQGPYSSVGQEYWYGWSIFVPEDYPNIYPTNTALGQFHQKDVNRPPVMFQNYNGGYWLDFSQTNDKNKGYRLLIPKEQFRDQWHDIVVHVKWSEQEDGFIKIWVNGVQKIDFSGPLTRYNYPIYFKYGIYRSFISRYKNANNINYAPAQIVYFDEVRKGRSREDVDPGFGK